MTPSDLVSQAGGRRRPGPAAHSLPAGSRGSTVRSHGPNVGGPGAHCRCCAVTAVAADLAVTRAPTACAAHAECLIRQRSDVTPLGRARSAPRSHCSGDSRSAHSPLAAPRECGPLRSPPGPGAGSSGKPGRAAQLQQGALLSESQADCRCLLKLSASQTADRFRKARPVNPRFKTFSTHTKLKKFTLIEKRDLGLDFK